MRISIDWILRRSILVALLGLLLVATPGPAHAARPAMVRVVITGAGERPVALCLPGGAGDVELRNDLLGAQSLAGLIEVARAWGGGICAEAHPGLAQRAQPTAQQAGLVIDFGDGRVLTFCIDLGDDGQATGEELLRASGLPVVIEYVGGMGGAVCSIGGTGSNFPSEPCFAKCSMKPGEACIYWAYARLVDGRWRGSAVGASSTTVRAGEVNGWAWGAGEGGGGALPPQGDAYTFAAICAAGSPTSTPTSTQAPPPTDMPTALPTAEPLVFVTITPSPAPPTLEPPTATRATPTPERATSAPTATDMPTATSAPTTTNNPTATSAPTAAPAVALAETPTISSMPPATPEAPSGTPLQIWLPITGAADAPQATPAPPSATPAAVAAAPTDAPPAASPVAAVEEATSALAPATPEAPGAARAQPEPASDASRGYLAFGGMALFLIGIWAWLRARRGRGAA